MEQENKTLNKFYKLARKAVLGIWVLAMGLIVVIFINLFITWEPYNTEAQTSRSIPFNADGLTYTVPGNLVVEDTISGLSPLKLADDIEFVGATSDDILYRMFVQGTGAQGANLFQVGNGAFEDTLIIETVGASNANFMHLMFFDKTRGRPSLTLNTGTSTRASNFENSLMVGFGSTTLDADYNNCIANGAISVDCDTALTGGDLLVADDIEILGNLYVHGTLNDISAKIEKTSDQSLNHNANTKITFDTEVYDTDGMVDLGTSDTRITIQTAGKYMCTGQSNWEDDSVGTRVLRVRLNNVNVGSNQSMAEGQSQNQVHYTGEADVGDYFEFQARQQSGDVLDFMTALTYFECRKVN